MIGIESKNAEGDQTYADKGGPGITCNTTSRGFVASRAPILLRLFDLKFW